MRKLKKEKLLTVDQLPGPVCVGMPVQFDQGVYGPFTFGGPVRGYITSLDRGVALVKTPVRRRAWCNYTKVPLNDLLFVDDKAWDEPFEGLPMDHPQRRFIHVGFTSRGVLPHIWK